MAVFNKDGTGFGGKAVLLAEDDPEVLAIAERYGGVAAMNEDWLGVRRHSIACTASCLR